MKTHRNTSAPNGFQWFPLVSTHFSKPCPEADAANYDDWNELFCDPLRMADSLRLEDGTRLFDLPHQQRFGALGRVNWRRALAANMVKTHREVHSLWGVFASCHRVVLLHAVLFVPLEPI